MHLPLRYIAEVNGFTVDYDADTEKNRVTNPADGTYLLITPGSNAVTKYAADRTLIGSSNAPLLLPYRTVSPWGRCVLPVRLWGWQFLIRKPPYGIYVVILQEARTSENALAEIEEAYQKGL